MEAEALTGVIKNTCTAHKVAHFYLNLPYISRLTLSTDGPHAFIEYILIEYIFGRADPTPLYHCATTKNGKSSHREIVARLRRIVDIL